MKFVSTRLDWRFGLLWTLAMAIAWTVGGDVGYVVGNSMRLDPVSFVIAILLYGCILAGCVGLIQWFLLQRIGLNPRWIWKSALAGSLGQIIGIAGLLILSLLVLPVKFWFPATDLFISRLGYTSGIPIILLGLGTTVSRVQYSILKQYVSQAHWWIWASAIGWFFGALVQVLVIPLVTRPSLGMHLPSLLTGSVKSFGWAENLIGGCVFGVITGICLIRLLRSTQRQLD
jgi:hypothetical protein